MLASMTIFLGCTLNTPMTLVIKGIAMRGMAHADNAPGFILAGIIMYVIFSISFSLHVELSDYHCCIHDCYFQVVYIVKLSAIITHVLYLSDMQ